MIHICANLPQKHDTFFPYSLMHDIALSFFTKLAKMKANLTNISIKYFTTNHITINCTKLISYTGSYFGSIVLNTPNTIQRLIFHFFTYIIFVRESLNSISKNFFRNIAYFILNQQLFFVLKQMP